jgi:DNA-binding MarR family transcriptional regulator
MSLEMDPLTRVVSDPLALRALAHPLRMKLHMLVGREGTLTAAEAARQLGISQALASHHLHQLAKYGFIEPAEADDNRSRPWKVTATSQRFLPDQPEAQDASDVIQRYALDQASQQLADWQTRRHDVEDRRWIELTDVASGVLYLTVEEMAEFRAALAAIITPLVTRRRIGDHASRPAGARPVAFTVVATPIPVTEHGG